MPKTTFFNLSEEKRNSVMNASKKEFSRVSLNEALVKNIVLDAGIPRGSFYQYFEDIDDCFYYVLDTYSKDIKQKLLLNLNNSKGDILKSYYDLYIYILEIINDPKNKDFFEKLFLNMNYKTEKMFTPNFNDGLNYILNAVDISKLNINSKFGIGYVLDIVESVMLHNIVESYKRNISKEKNIEIFEKEMYLIANGIVRQW